MTYILGLSAFYHDSAVTLIKDGQIVCALQEERFSRIKQDRGFPRHALRACLEQAGISLADVAWLAYYEDPEVKFERICTTYKRNFPVARWPSPSSTPVLPRAGTSRASSTRSCRGCSRTNRCRRSSSASTT